MGLLAGHQPSMERSLLAGALVVQGDTAHISLRQMVALRQVVMLIILAVLVVVQLSLAVAVVAVPAVQVLEVRVEPQLPEQVHQ
jgi:hypothetical protein